MSGVRASPHLRLSRAKTCEWRSAPPSPGGFSGWPAARLVLARVANDALEHLDRGGGQSGEEHVLQQRVERLRCARVLGEVLRLAQSLVELDAGAGGEQAEHPCLRAVCVVRSQQHAGAWCSTRAPRWVRMQAGTECGPAGVAAQRANRWQGASGRGEHAVQRRAFTVRAAAPRARALLNFGAAACAISESLTRERCWRGCKREQESGGGCDL